MTATPNAVPKDTRLGSWKAIAAFFSKDERTVKRWEKERGLPVHRLPGSRGSVFAYSGELEHWLAGPENAARKGEEISAGGELVALPVVVADAAPRTATLIPEASAQTDFGPKTLPAFWRRSLLWIVPILVVGGFLIYSSAGHSPIRFGKALAAHHEPDSTTQDFYLKGRFYFEKRTPQDLNTAIDAFTQAIVHDPAYAQPYVGLADSYSLLREFGTLATPEAEQRARAAAQKAVELDPNLAEAHSSLAFAEFWGFLDAADADREFRRAIELDPTLARAHHWYATFLAAVLRPQEALAEIERARQLDPSSKAILADKGGLLIHFGNREEGVALLKQMEASDPSFRSSHQYLGVLYWDEGNYEDALDEFHKEAVLRGDNSVVSDVTARQEALRTGGVPGLLEWQLSAALRAYQHENGPAYEVAIAYAQLHRRDDAMKYLQLARQRHDPWLAYIETAPEFHGLHVDPEFRQLVADLGLPPIR